VLGACRPALGPRYGVHVEVFAQNRVVVIPASIGTVGPRSYAGGRIIHARCYGQLVTLDPTGVVLVGPGRTPRLGELFHSWGQPVSGAGVAGFAAGAGRQVVAFVSGRRWTAPLSELPLLRHAEIVLEAGPFVAPHRSYRFPAGI
jgi:hypothetical protein